MNNGQSLLDKERKMFVYMCESETESSYACIMFVLALFLSLRVSQGS